MKWKYFTEHYDDWEEDRTLKAVQSLTDFGTPGELVYHLLYLDEDPGKLLLSRALSSGMVLQPAELLELDGLSLDCINSAIEDSVKKGVRFTLADVLELLDMNYLIDRALLQKAVLQSDSSFTEREILMFENSLDGDTIQQLRKRQRKKEGFFSRLKKRASGRENSYGAQPSGIFVFNDEEPVRRSRFRKGDKVSFLGDIFDTIDAEGMYIEGVVLEVKDGMCRIGLAETAMTPWIAEEHLRKISFM
ncbi:MAG: hypothetical protein IKG08_00100 [Eubacterium sp.]|nr:hypothetical protein [Eubacterium sp.]